ncbi:MAG: hypothetical protein Q7S41_00225 [Candidatus Limnocylindria bacterium]|nr:hypothetical protein [Candidatus Limnocylindria bacterium]
MIRILALVRLLPLGVARRLAIAFVEIVLAVVVLTGSVVVGHDLREWRTWYGDPGTAHAWAPTPAPTATAAPEARRP